jgi:DNA-binding CsgD family transcriptional regulator
MRRKIAFIGLGDQGAPMAQAPASSHDLRIWARREASYEPFAGLEHRRVDSALALAGGVEILCLCLPGDAELSALLFEGGVANALRDGAIVLIHATGDPTIAEKLARRLGEKGIRLPDAPVSGGRSGAINRTLTCFACGDRATIEACQAAADLYQAFLDEGPGSGMLLRRAYARAAAPASASADRDVLPFVGRLLSRWDARHVGSSPAQPKGRASDTLTARELDVLVMINKGFANKHIARTLEISPETVKSHVKHIFSKLAVGTRTEAVFRASFLGLL